MPADERYILRGGGVNFSGVFLLTFASLSRSTEAVRLGIWVISPTTA